MCRKSVAEGQKFAQKENLFPLCCVPSKENPPRSAPKVSFFSCFRQNARPARPLTAEQAKKDHIRKERPANPIQQVRQPALNSSAHSPTSNRNSDRDRKAILTSVHRPIHRVSLKRFPSSLRNQPNQIRPPHTLRSSRPGVMVDLLLDDRAINVVRPKPQRDLRHLRRNHLPVAL